MSAVLPITKSRRSQTLCDDCGKSSAHLTLTTDFHTAHLCLRCAYGIIRDLKTVAEKIASDNIAEWIAEEEKK